MKEQTLKSTRTILVKALATMFIAAFIFVVTGFKSNASSVVQTAEGDKSATIKWTETTSSDYSIGWARVVEGNTSDAYTKARAMAEKRSVVVSGSTKSYTVKNLANDAQYAVVLRYSSGTAGKYYYYCSYNYYVYTKMTPVKNIKQVEWYKYAKSLHVEWDRKPGSVQYEYRFTTNKGKVIKTEVTSSNSFSHGIKNNQIYKVQVRAIRTPYSSDSTVGKQVTGWSAAEYMFTQPTIKSAKVKGGKLTIKWDKINGATNYTIYASTKQSKGYKKVGSVSAKKGSFTIKKLKGKKFKASKTYYVYVVANKKVKGKVITKDVTYTYKIKGSSVSEGYK